MLQKLEDFYLGTLRFVVILVATLLLVAMFVLGTKATSLVEEKPQPTDAKPAVEVASLRAAVVEQPLAGGSEDRITSAPGEAADPNKIYYQQVAQAISAFLSRAYPGQYDPNLDGLADFVKSRVESDRPSERQAMFAKELAKAVPELLADNGFTSYSRDRDPNELITKALDAFAAEFDRQIAAVDAANEAAENKYLAEQAQSRQNLLFAAYAFGVFLLIVFLSIIIRIERNLRPAGLPK